MAKIGTLGDVVFETSSARIRTFRDYKRSSAARLASHEIIGQKPVTEYLGPGVDSITFSMTLSVYCGVNPQKETEKLRKMMQEGQYVDFIIAGAPVSKNLWIIDSINETVTAFDGFGNIIRSELELSIHEYAANYHSDINQKNDTNKGKEAEKNGNTGNNNAEK